MTEIKFFTDAEDFENDYMDVIRAFNPYIKCTEEGEKLSLNFCEKFRDNFQSQINYRGKLYCYDFSLEKQFMDDIGSEQYDVKYRAQLKRHTKTALYEFLSNLSGQRLPYGSLTGIRPTKLYREVKEKGIDADAYFAEKLKVSGEKLSLIREIAKMQQDYCVVGEDEVDVFVNIPICTSRCSYCSFISAQLDKVKRLVDPYCALVLKELEETRKIIDKRALKVRSVYIGGGTPTSLDDNNFQRILNAAKFDCSEYTVEAGRPDTITESKLKIMHEMGVNRISINPQTFNPKTLELIGRNHSVKQIYDVYEAARRYPFAINMDLIAMLPGESFEDFKHSVDCAVAVAPDNVTVHSLALKKGSALKVGGYEDNSWEKANAMIDYSRRQLSESGYAPYYMYKQKYMSGNLENTGYCRDGKVCVYNVDIMEETASIIANGAGAISKRLYSKDRLERLANPKGLDVYLQREEKIIRDKREFFQ